MMFALAIALCCLASTVTPVPVYGTTRYGRAPWAAYPPPSAAAYYTRYPMYSDDLYYPAIAHYPYYPVVRAYQGKGDLYQTPLYPYYYQHDARMRPYLSDLSDDLQDEVHEEDAVRSNGRSDALPVGQETWFEGEASAPRWQSDIDDVNVAFMQNLIASEVYNNNKNNLMRDEEDGDNKLVEEDYDRSQDYYGDRDTRDFEDEDVRELKALAGKPLYHSPKTSNTFTSSDKKYKQQQQQQQQIYADYPTAVRREEDHYPEDYDSGWINWNNKRSPQPKSTLSPPTSTTTAVSSSSTTTKAPARVIAGGGQKEEVLLRPATPVRHPFPEPVLKMLAANGNQNANQRQKKRVPSVYDTIKQMLSMDEQKQRMDKARLQKRFVATEEDLVSELKGLKRKSPA